MCTSVNDQPLSRCSLNVTLPFTTNQKQRMQITNKQQILIKDENKNSTLGLMESRVTGREDGESEPVMSEKKRDEETGVGSEARRERRRMLL